MWFIIKRPKNIHLFQRRCLSNTTRIAKIEDLPAAAYKPEVVEKNRYEVWEKCALFKADNESNKKTFSMVLPPPNVTGKLHLGHALASTVQDVIVRRKRSLGHNVLWLPGTDHAGIATQGVVEKFIHSKHNTTRHDLGREEFCKEVWKWKARHGNVICQQLRTLGCSLDWSRETFTMDPSHTRAVHTAFIQLHRQGLIHRQTALVNWCPALKSTISDIEVESLDISEPVELRVPGYDKPVKFGLMYDLVYEVAGSQDKLVVSTTMPETMLGDVAVAVNPKDERYTHLHSKSLIHPFSGKHIPVICDEVANMEVGTGAVKITPAHSKVDFQVAKRHNLPLVQVVDETGRIVGLEMFEGIKRYECRQKLVDALNDMGLLVRVTPHRMTLPVCSRSGAVIDHIPKEQWFLTCKTLNERAQELVRGGHLKMEPEKYVKNWYDWTSDNREWCISRQLWWGHQIPAYRCGVGDDTVWVAADNVSDAKLEASKLLGANLNEIEAERDEDVLDTWFSSAIYPFAALGWPETTRDYQKFYPLSLMATGHDILGFWVHRMVILGLALTVKLPFNNVLLHGIICDSKGAKMSKSRGNVIDPLDVINGITLDKLKEKTLDMHKDGVLSKEEVKKALSYHKSNFGSTNGIPECGVDALRFTILSQDIKSNFVSFDVNLCHTNKLFGNKIWQSIKYTKMSFDKLQKCDSEISRDDLTYFDRWILSRLANAVLKVNQSMDNYDFHIATKSIKSLIYNDFCDFYLETTKPGFESDVKSGYAHAHTLSVVLNTSLRCLAPFMIYLTQEVIPKIPSFDENIIHNFNDSEKQYFDFPVYEDFEHWRNEDIESSVTGVLDMIDVIRQLKGFYGISNKVRPKIILETKDDNLANVVDSNRKVLLNLTRCGDIAFKQSANTKYVSGYVNDRTKVSVELLVDDVDNVLKTSRKKLGTKIGKIEESIRKMEEKLTAKVKDSELSHNGENEKLVSKRTELNQLKRLMNS